jgi:N-acetylmuramoyl-L-alanine amidase
MRLLLISFLLLVCLPLSAANLQGIRVSETHDGTRLVLDLDNKPQFKIFTLDNPSRLVIDIQQSVKQDKLALPDFSNTPIKKLRQGVKANNALRFVFDLSEQVTFSSQTLTANEHYPHRLVVDLTHQKPNPVISTEPAPQVSQEVEPAPTNQAELEPAVAPPAIKKIKPVTRRDIIIAIDPGHGGSDPGAMGNNGTKEKDVVLAIARRLAEHVNNEPGMRAYMTRNSDTFIRLRDRIKLARKNGADMFISIHADAFHNFRAKGASVYVLSEKGASSEAAKLLADKENAADLVGGVSLEDKDELLASVLLDLSQTASLEGSLEVANSVLGGLKRVGHVHKKNVESAGFVVLKSPDIPSILVETAFISNPEEERKLRSPRHQEKLAKAMMAGIRSYFRRNPLPGTNIPQQHIVARGDTLSTIAQRYQVSMLDLKKQNNKNTNVLKIGEVLTIP